ITGDAKNLTNHPSNDIWPAWSPDGAHIVFTSDRDGSDNLYIMDAGGSHLRALTHEKAGTTCRTPAWSPDGKRIAYSRQPATPFLLEAVNADALAEPTLAPAAGPPAWSPDGKKLAYLSAPSAAKPNRLWVMDADGRNARELIAASCLFPAWSPDGKRIA